MTQPQQQGGSILTRKTGPLPNWAWMGLILLVALGYSIWQRNRTDQAAETEGPAVEEVPGDQDAPPVFILPQNPQPTVPINITLPAPATPVPAPPGGGRPPIGINPPKAPALPKPPAGKPVVAYDTVKVVKYTSKNPPWASTMWGIAKQKGYGSAGNNWQTIWADPRNASLRAKRGKPQNIQPGDIVYVRQK